MKVINKSTLFLRLGYKQKVRESLWLKTKQTQTPGVDQTTIIRDSV